MQKISLAVAFVLAAAVSVSAQPVNIDLCTLTGVPVNTYGAGAGQIGTWNSAYGALLDTAGNPIAGSNFTGPGPTCANFTGVNSAVAASSSNAGDAQLMNDFHDGAGTWTVSGLAFGQYHVYTYAAAPDSATFSTNVNVNGMGAQAVVGQWGLTGGGQLNFLAGNTHALHTPVTINAGTPNISIVTTVASGFASLNGIQIVPVPEPSTVALLGLGAISLIRRRR